MSSQVSTKLNRLLKSWPTGTVALQSWLDSQGVYRQLTRRYILSGWVARIGRGAVIRDGDVVDWLGGLFALQSQLGLTVRVGAVSALEIHERAHFVPLGQGRRVVLVSDRKETLPGWFCAYPWQVSLQHRCLTLFDETIPQATSQFKVGSFSVDVSSAELAILEEMHMAYDNSAIEHTLMLMEGLSTLRPTLVQLLLEKCLSIKAKRLFLWAAERSQHSWLEKLNQSRFDIGKGKRQLFKGGQFDPKYMITVPPKEKLPDV